MKEDIEAYADWFARRDPLVERAKRGSVSPFVAAVYVANMRRLIVRSVPFLEQARRGALARGNAPLAAYYARKIDEETGHETWADADLAKLRSTFQANAGANALPAVTELIEYVERAVDDEPSRLLAYTLFAEYATVLVGPLWVGLLENKCGIPATFMSNVTHHVELDRQHAAEGFREAASLLPGEVDDGPVRATLADTIGYFKRFFRELSELAS